MAKNNDSKRTECLWINYPIEEFSNPLFSHSNLVAL